LACALIPNKEQIVNRKSLTQALCVCIFALPVFAQSTVVISQVYGGGGNAGSTYKNDFVELFNRSNSPVSLNGYSVQYASATGTTWQVTNLTNVTLEAGQYYLVQEAAGTGGTTNLPTPDATGTIAVSATAGKFALVSNTTPLTGVCPTEGVLDFVGFGTTANCLEGAGPTPAPSNINAALRAAGGCADTNVNSADFAAGALAPRNTATALNPCTVSISGTGSANPASVVPGNATTLNATITPDTLPTSTGIAVSCDLSAIGGSAAFSLPNTTGNIYSASYTVPAATADATYSLACTVSDAQSRSANFSISLTINSTPLSLAPPTLPSGTYSEAYAVTISVTNGTGCTFASSGTPPTGLTLSPSGLLSGIPALPGSFTFTVNAACSNGTVSQGYTVLIVPLCESGSKTSTAIHTIQGTGATSLLAGQTVEVEGIVVGDFQLSTQVKGFYLQEPDATWDADPLTSEGLFVFDNLAGPMSTWATACGSGAPSTSFPLPARSLDPRRLRS